MGRLTVADLVVGYGPSDEILKGVDFAVEEGEIVAVIGPNGAGKSTLLKAIAGLLRPSRGTVALNDEPITAKAPRDICRLGVAYVPQEDNIFPTMSVRENLEMGGYADPANNKRRIEAMFARFTMLAEKRRQPARALSGGERQLLAMAMGLMVEPSVLLLDEPSAGLSPAAAERLFENVIAVNRDGVSVAMVEQNAREALEIANRAYILVGGRNSRSGPAGDLAADPDIQRLFLGA
ncbi:MAG TPA: ABC transporter ATP-binding protein [Stellaceae bacterium]|jgi:branched-chain amino acid transport system ATP-binding protein/neutral amino acid transport system ATP-binding protein|nr:ABC transporter ATP-binding protein [Stellaceae bacterium]